MSITITTEKVDNLQAHYDDPCSRLVWPSVFVFPGWFENWWRSFGEGYKPLVLVINEDEETIGIAPLKVRDSVASFIGDNSVCDYLDFIVAPSKEKVFSQALFDHLPTIGVRSLVLETLRPASIALHNVAGETKRRNLNTVCENIDVSFEMDLPATWEAYLALLGSKHRRDAERKIRQLEGVAPVRFSVLIDDEAGETDLALFFQMMTESRCDKALFLTPQMRGYFIGLAKAMSAYGVFRLAFLDVGKARVASIMFFEYQGRIYLYNSGYMPQFANVDAGLVSKLYCIRYATEKGFKVFDFLKGPEAYKSQLGGREVKLSRCTIELGP
jgi:CelD/BcsL family acetyltransferase involved in cellulose biosynthesis